MNYMLGLGNLISFGEVSCLFTSSPLFLIAPNLAMVGSRGPREKFDQLVVYIWPFSVLQPVT